MEKIIYIMGAGRSGTTLLDIMLGNAPGIFSCGELTRYAELRGVPRLDDHQSSTRLFWARFKEQLEQKVGPLDFAALDRYYREFDHHPGFLRNYTSAYSRTDFGKYRDFLQSFYETLIAANGSPVLVDSSKYANRALTLWRVFGKRVHFIYLVRSPVGVCRSFAKKNVEQPSRSWLSANVYYYTANLMCSLVERRIGAENPFLVVTYEDLVNNTAGVLERIEEAFAVDLQGVRKRIDDHQPFEVGTLFDGNRLRLGKQIVVKKDADDVSYGVRDRISLIVNSCWWH